VGTPAASTAAAAAATSAAASGDADLPGRLCDPGNGRLSATAAAATASAGAGTRVTAVKPDWIGPGAIPGRFFLVIIPLARF
jgi:hypothetical protein